MTEGTRASQVIPVLVAALICDVAATDPSTGKKNLIGIFDRLTGGTFPTARHISLYFKTTDAEGHYEILARFVRVAGNEVIAEAKGEVDLPDRLASNDFLIDFQSLHFPEPGRYEFQIFMNKVLLGSAFLDARQRPEATQAKQG